MPARGDEELGETIGTAASAVCPFPDGDGSMPIEVRPPTGPLNGLFSLNSPSGETDHAIETTKKKALRNSWMAAGRQDRQGKSGIVLGPKAVPPAMGYIQLPSIVHHKFSCYIVYDTRIMRTVKH